MSWRDAPLYVEAFDLSGWLIERVESWRHEPLARRATDEAVELVSSVSLALTFPAVREHHLARTDEGIVRLRAVLRIAESVGCLSNRRLRFAAERLGVIGRMVGGWRKRLQRRQEAGEHRM